VRTASSLSRSGAPPMAPKISHCRDSTSAANVVQAECTRALWAHCATGHSTATSPLPTRGGRLPCPGERQGMTPSTGCLW
jgi:hypothetical protein